VGSPFNLYAWQGDMPEQRIRDILEEAEMEQMASNFGLLP
jgi:hypothetical protein